MSLVTPNVVCKINVNYFIDLDVRIAVSDNTLSQLTVLDLGSCSNC